MQVGRVYRLLGHYIDLGTKRTHHSDQGKIVEILNTYALNEAVFGYPVTMLQNILLSSLPKGAYTCGSLCDDWVINNNVSKYTQ